MTPAEIKRFKVGMLVSPLLNHPSLVRGQSFPTATIRYIFADGVMVSYYQGNHDELNEKGYGTFIPFSHLITPTPTKAIPGMIYDGSNGSVWMGDAEGRLWLVTIHTNNPIYPDELSIILSPREVRK